MCKIETQLHTSLDVNEIFDIGWFPDQLTEQGRRAARNLSAIEVRIGGLAKSDQAYDDGMEHLRELIAVLANIDVTSMYVTLVEYKPAPRSKVRSYKGLFPKKGKLKTSGGFIFEDEAGVSPTTSLQVGVAEVLSGNAAEAVELSQDFARAFFLISRMSIGPDKWPDILLHVRECLDIKGTVLIDYMKLIPVLCSDGLALLTIASDHRGDLLNVRVFLDESMVSLMEGVITKAIAAL